MKVPPLDLAAEYREIKKEADARIRRVLESGFFILGGEVHAFESSFAKLIGTKFAIGVNSGTDALHLALLALNVGKGDEVITTAHTYIATAAAIARTGAKPVFIDIDPETFNMHPDLIERKITKKTKAILPVHLYGQPCDMTRIVNIGQRRGIHVVEDCAQAAGATWKGKTAGSFGDMGCFSFYPTKILGAYGDGGAAATSSAKLAARISSLRNQSDPRKTYRHAEIGFNSRLDTLQAAILNAKLKQFGKWNQARLRAAATYDKLLRSIPEVRIPKRLTNLTHVYHQYTIRAERRDELLRFLKENGIAAGIYYPVPLHLQPCFRELGYRRGSLPEAERASREIISLPIFPQIKSSQQEFVASKIKEFCCHYLRGRKTPRCLI